MNFKKYFHKLKKSYIVIIIVLIAIQILVIARNTQSGFFSFFWYCDFIPAVLAVVFIGSRVQAVKGILNVGLFAQLIYILVIFSKLLFGVTLLGFVFNFPFTVLYVLPTIIIHFTTILAFLVVYREKPTIEALMYSFVLLVFMYVFVISLVVPDVNHANNYNFIFYSSSFPEFKYYTEIWVPLTFVGVVIPTYLFQYFIYLLYKISTAYSFKIGNSQYFKHKDS